MANTTHDRIPKDQWPEKFQGYEIGNNGYLLVSFDDGGKWFEIDTAKDVTNNHSVEAVDSDCRRSGLFKASLPGKIELSVDAEMLLDERDNVYRALEKCSVSGGIFRLCVLTEGGDGPEFYAHLSDFGRQEPLSGVVSCQAKYSLVDFIHWWTSEEDEDGERANPIKVGTDTAGGIYLDHQAQLEIGKGANKTVLPAITSVADPESP